MWLTIKNSKLVSEVKNYEKQGRPTVNHPTPSDPCDSNSFQWYLNTYLQGQNKDIVEDSTQKIQLLRRQST